VNNKIILGLVLFVLVCSNAISQTLIVSSSLKLDVEPASSVLHSGETLILKYSDWTLSHQILNPKTFYKKVDLTGISHEFVMHMFNKGMKDLPEWLMKLAKEQADTFAINQNSTVRFNLKTSEVMSVYDNDMQQGNIFILEPSYINHFQLIGSKARFQSFLELLKDS